MNQVYYELDEERKKSETNDVAICRVEQLCPFPYDLIQRELKRYPSRCQNSGLCLMVLVECVILKTCSRDLQMQRLCGVKKSR